MDENLDAVVLCPAITSDYTDCLNALHNKGIKTIVLGNSLGEGKRFTEIRMASEISGSLAAEYTSLLCGQDKSSVIFIGNKDMEDHRRKTEYFQRIADEKNLAVRGVFETQDDVDIAYALTSKVAQQADLGVIYVATGNSVAVCKCLVDTGMSDKIKVVATDIFPDMHPFVESGIIPATIYQKPVRMGRMAIRAIYDAIATGTCPQSEILVYPQLVLKSNYSIYADYLSQVEAQIADDFVLSVGMIE